MKPQAPFEFPFGYDERTTMALTPTNDIVIAHPTMPAMIYDEQNMRWVQLATEEEKEKAHE